MADLFEYNTDTMSSIPVSSINNFNMLKNFESGGGGLISTADDYILFLDAMCNDGVSADGYRILSRDSIDLMCTDQLHNISRDDFEKRFEKKAIAMALEFAL
jgi:CubicO group peptidase (beta-lactamase class C family)